LKVAIVNNQAPFVRGGAELLAEWLVEKLSERGHEGQIIRLPFAWEPPARIVDSMLAARLVRIPNVDRVVALKFPAYYVEHDDKLLWLLHQFRQVHELWGTPMQGLPDDAEGRAIRDAVRTADRDQLSRVRAIYTNSKIVGRRLRDSTGLDSTPLYPPLRDPENYRCDGYEPFVFYPSRVNGFKRQYLAIEAMSHVPAPIKLIVAGPPDSAAEEARVRRLVAERELEDRVELRLGWMEEETKRDLLARAAAVLYLPFDEDSYGYVTLEAFQSRKAVITCTDSGGTDELVFDGETGWVCEPDEQAVGQAIAEAAGSASVARSRGEDAFSALGRLRIDWDHVVATLTAP
jgi:glycosyltransferase involved in cell wall biosynthesis